MIERRCVKVVRACAEREFKKEFGKKRGYDVRTSRLKNGLHSKYIIELLRTADEVAQSLTSAELEESFVSAK
jgi:hypothetical protein